ncbi:hypothetical protein Pfo_016744 [Paulownia fortunei]|nr:hypothetical protein Pfo_016744 [Paulownia fortunei]
MEHIEEEPLGSTIGGSSPFTAPAKSRSCEDVEDPIWTLCVMFLCFISFFFPLIRDKVLSQPDRICRYGCISTGISPLADIFLWPVSLSLRLHQNLMPRVRHGTTAFQV